MTIVPTNSTTMTLIIPAMMPLLARPDVTEIGLHADPCHVNFARWIRQKAIVWRSGALSFRRIEPPKPIQWTMIRPRLCCMCWQSRRWRDPKVEDYWGWRRNADIVDFKDHAMVVSSTMSKSDGIMKTTLYDMVIPIQGFPSGRLSEQSQWQI
jgi:hypothetical protein